MRRPAFRKREGFAVVLLGRVPAIACGVLHGPFAGLTGLYRGQKPRERVEVLLAILGGAQRVTLAADAVEQVR